MIKLRYYQDEAIKQLRGAFRDNKRVILCLPTGAGKTLTFSEMVRLSYERGNRSLVITDRTELFKQTIKSINKFGVAVEEISPDRKHVDTRATVYLAMVETMKRRIAKLKDINPDLIIIDEAHKASFNKVFEIFPDSYVIGATATPIGKHFYEYYSGIVQNIDVPELIDQGFLVNYKAYQMEDDFSDLSIKAGNFTDDSLMSHFDKPKLYDGVIEWWNKYAKNLKTIVFNVNIKHTIEMHKKFLDVGISAEYITSKTPDDERKRILESFTKGHFTVLLNCGILTTGYDEDTIQCVVLNRATTSYPLFMQCIGRGSRPWKGCVNKYDTPELRKQAIAESPKPNFICLDFGGNHDRHGLWNEGRIFKIEPPKKKREGTAPIKKCGNDDCECIVPASAKICSYCGYIFPENKRELSEGVMVEVIPKHLSGRRISDLSLSELIELEATKKYKSSYIWRVVRSMGEQSIKDFAKLKGYKYGWTANQLDKIDDNKYTNYIVK